ncbi:hypothetical protein A0H81_04506 [Grifola frondosa]|uniref:Uncharacterized protein n=1 Tax=Grifola frondosa TaxID=5627 RepID=A0A1C7MEL2_GRIFR|nr:hypothetical protein A0H81_04506 [Grifola frondosa]
MPVSHENEKTGRVPPSPQSAPAAKRRRTTTEPSIGAERPPSHQTSIPEMLIQAGTAAKNASSNVSHPILRGKPSCHGSRKTDTTKNKGTINKNMADQIAAVFATIANLETRVGAHDEDIGRLSGLMEKLVVSTGEILKQTMVLHNMVQDVTARVAKLESRLDNAEKSRSDTGFGDGASASNASQGSF